MIDHLVVAVPDLAAARATAVEHWGVTPTPGGPHVGHGTRNELLGLGGDTYLELIGPDVEQADHDGVRPFGVDRITVPTLVGWCARPRRPLADVVAAANAVGYDAGAIQSMSRRRPDGVLLEWELTFRPSVGEHVAVIPFLIDWGSSEHPTASLGHELQLVELRIEHPDPTRVQIVLDALDAASGVVVVDGDAPRLSATIDGPSGRIVL